MEIGERLAGRILILAPAGRIDNETSPAFQVRLIAEVDWHLGAREDSQPRPVYRVRPLSHIAPKEAVAPG